MKGTFFITLVVVFSILVIPLSALAKPSDNLVPTAKTELNIPYDANLQKIKVLKDNNVLELPVNDYLFGVVAAEMPALYETEAIKAQAVAAYTFVCYKKASSSNGEYDITSDPETAQCFITREEASARWGEKYNEYADKLDDCISAVLGELITHNNQPIFAAYHAISSGTTNPCCDVWGSDLPYLISVNSSGDCFADDYLTEAKFTTGEIQDKLKDIAVADGQPENFFADIITANNGLVKQINYCGFVVTGSQICKALGLRSSNFSISYADGYFTFIVKGYGHGVGMSQNGANHMAKQGNSYQEILLHYYPGTTLQKN